MAQSTFSVRMDDNLKKQFDFLCSDFGMTASTAFNIFARTVVRQRRIPFEITSYQAEITKVDGYNAFMALRNEAAKNRLQDLSLEEINAEITSSRSDAEESRL